MFSLLLRVILCISLVGNGVGAAQASARMAFEHAAHVQQAGSAEPVAAEDSLPPCHHHAGAKAHAMHDERVAAHQHAAPSGKTAPPECCKGKQCTCACAHASCPAVTTAAAAFVPQTTARVVAVVAVDHPQPRLPHLIRPPIG